MAVRLQREDFDIGAEIAALTMGRTDIGAVVSFAGLCRETEGEDRLVSLTLEHYPAMAQAELERIEAEARRRWPLLATQIIHRHGRLIPGERIVLVIAAARHRAAAFDAASFLMDFLKTRAPFWKKAETLAGTAWVEDKDADQAAADRWQRRDAG